MNNLQTLLLAFDIILFVIFFILANYIFYVLTFKSGYKNKLKLILNLLVFGSMDIIALFVLINIFNY